MSRNRNMSETFHFPHVWPSDLDLCDKAFKRPIHLAQLSEDGNKWVLHKMREMVLKFVGPDLCHLPPAPSGDAIVLLPTTAKSGKVKPS